MPCATPRSGAGWRRCSPTTGGSTCTWRGWTRTGPTARGCAGLTAVGAVLQALTDGLALQAVFDPAFDLQAAIDAVQALLGPTLGKATAE